MSSKLDLYGNFGDRSIMFIKQLELGPMGNFTYLLGDNLAKMCAVIDPGWEIDKIIDESKKAGVNITHILLTHTHFDHANGVGKLVKKTGAKVYVHRLEAFSGALQFNDGGKIMIGNIEVQCLHTPGHSPGSACFLAEGAVFTGDTLFVDGIGRTDLDGSDPEEMFKSLKRLAGLPDGTVVYPGHNYGREPATTIGEQKKRNPYMKCNNIGEFLTW